MKEQTIFINLDDSGKLSKKETLCVYGGLVFLDKKEKDKFITQYRSIVKEIRCKYCKKKTCNMKCPEIKSFNIKPADKRRIMNYLKKYYTVGSIIFNKQIYSYIMDNKASKGRYLDYTLRRLVKEIVAKLVETKTIDPYKPVKIVINIDEQTTKSNGYYNLRNGIIEDLLYGVSNFNYNSYFPPLLHDKLTLTLSYQDSSKSYVVQGADMLAGTIRKKSIEATNKHVDVNSNLEFVDCKIFFPHEKKSRKVT